MPSILLVGSMSARDRDAKMPTLQKVFTQTLDKQVKVNICYYDELRFDLAPQNFTVWDCRNNQDIGAYTVVIFTGAIYATTLAYAASRYLHIKNVAHVNDFQAYRPLNKLPQLIDMYELGLTFPRSLYLANHQHLQQHISTHWKFPLVLKTINSSQGRFNYLVHSPAELAKILVKFPKRRFMVQEYIPNQGDYRVLTIGDQALVLYREAPDGKYLNNTSQGATIRSVPETTLPPKIIKGAHRLAAQAHMTIAGIDVVPKQNSEEYYFLEINTQPGLRSPAAKAYVADFMSTLLKGKNLHTTQDRVPHSSQGDAGEQGY